MKKLFTLFVVLLSIYNYSQVSVRGYYRKNGTYVQPHVRTAPNSTVTDNYSYRGNYNPNTEYTTTSSISSPSKSNYDKEWVDGYYRADGTYVSGYYRKKRATTTSSNNSNYVYSGNSSSNNYKSSTKKYVNTTNVNLRTAPEVSDNIIEELAFSDEVTSIEQLGYWDKVRVKRYLPSTNSYSMIDGYINSRYLTASADSENTYSSNVMVSESKYFRVKVDRTYFCNTPNIKDVRKAHLIYDTVIYAIAESKYFIYIEFTNSSGQTSIGWILKDDLIRE
ncbi:hypothetical protein [Epilithonimonas sp. UC225_85]|uniref:hypothetical protein n=1 Tax=Epilithonimonas sp. UC225_85 TaxID=3350167 RepID=UPI0036D2B10F